MEVLVTIAIPVYNGAQYIESTIQSIINQTYKNWRLLVINDGSTDNTIEIVQSIVNKDYRISIINDNCKKGLIERLNQSIDMTKTRYYARMDADDIMYITRLEEQVLFLESHSDIDVVGTSIMTIDTDNNIIGSGFSSGNVKGFIHPTIMGRTKWFKENRYCNWAVRAEDFELWCRSYSYSKFYAIGKPLLFYREFGVPVYNKTIKTLITLLRIYKRYREYNKTFFWFVKGYLITILKIIVYTVLNSIGKMDYIVKQRRRMPVPSNLCLTKEDLEICIRGAEKK